MHPESLRLKDKYFANDSHPYAALEAEIQSLVQANSIVLDGGCGHRAPVLAKLAPSVAQAVGIDLVDFDAVPAGVQLVKANLAALPFSDGSIDVAYSRSVLEHIDDPDAVFAELARVIRPNGHFVFLTANKYDYASVIARLIPNRLHPAIVRHVEGRPTEDTFPTRYRVNSRRDIETCARRHKFEIQELRYLGQYPNYFLFSPFLFRLGAHYELFLRRHKSLGFLRGWILGILRRR